MTEKDTKLNDPELIGGWLCLDFVNTVSWRGSDHSQEWLQSYSKLVSWSQHADILTGNEAHKLFGEAKLCPREASAVLKRAITLREAVHSIFSAIVDHVSPNGADLDTLNAELHEAMTRTQIAPTTDGYALTYAVNYRALDNMLWSIARSAADLLTSGRLNRIRKCAAKDCGWLFLDMSKNHSRRWCDMKDCGNRTKARRHYERKRAAFPKRART